MTETMPEMSEELKPCPFCGNAPQVDEGLVSCPLCRMTWIPPNMWNTRRAALARPAPAEGAALKTAGLAGYWLSQSEYWLAELPSHGVPEAAINDLRQNARVAVHNAVEATEGAVRIEDAADAALSAQGKRTMGTTYGNECYDIGVSDAAKRVRALSSPEDATPAETREIVEALRIGPLQHEAGVTTDADLMRISEIMEKAADIIEGRATPAAPVSVEEAVQAELLRVCNAYAKEGNMTAATAIDDAARCVAAVLAQQDRRAALREMQSIREEMEGESGA